LWAAKYDDDNNNTAASANINMGGRKSI